MLINDRLFQKSNYFNLEQITNGVFNAFAIQEAGALGNTAIIDLGDKTLIYDTFENPIIAKDLRVASELLTGRTAKWVVKSHFHPDHWFGNQVFPLETNILATQDSRENMVKFINEVTEEKSDSSELVEYLQEMKSQISSESNPEILIGIKSAVARWEL
jgi:glyoxylase-like metal-dependent hydrolase (beta-lactamase superfamily II)